MFTVSQPQEGISLIKPEGRLDAMAVPEFDDAAAKLLESKPNGLIFDLETTSFIDSSGLSSIVRLYKSLHQMKIPVAFCRVPGPVMSLFKLTRVNAVFKVFDSLEEASTFVSPKK